jgi:type I phosphodiesterase/nucleotide pyrophosphatase
VSRSRPVRRGLLLAGSCALLAGFAAPSPSAAQEATGSIASVACSLPRDELVRIWRGTQLGRSGDILVVPDEPNFLGSNYPHSGPWDYLQEVPLLWYGPGHVPATGSVPGRVTLADVAPTQAELVDYPFEAIDGRALPEVARGAGAPPKLVVTLVWDGGGRSVLDTWPHDWPYLRSLIEKGVWFDDAEVGSSPSITPAVHATIGTGAFPMHTGQVDSDFRLGDSLAVRSGGFGPGLLMEPTFADLYDLGMGNEPIIGTIGSVTWHLNMMSHGRMWGGGDSDIGILRMTLEDEGAEGVEWNLQGKNQPFYRLPPYVNGIPPVTAYTDELDRQDGARDGNWRQDSIAQARGGWDTPARVPYQTALVDKLIRREGFGADDVPDMLFLNYKIIDHVGHVWSTNSPEMRDTVEWQDAGLRELVGILNREVGKGEWVVVVTADHGHQFDPSVSGAFQVTPSSLEADLNAEFDDGDGAPAVQRVRTSQVYMDADEMKDAGATLDEVSRFIVNYTKAQASNDPSSLPASAQDDRVFSAAFPSEILGELQCLPEAGE